MKHLQAIFLTICLLVHLPACSPASSEVESTDTNWTVRQMASAIWEAGSQLEGTAILPGSELYESYLTTSYGLDHTAIASGAIWVAGGTSAQEVAVFQLEDSSASDDAVELLQTYLEARTGAFAGYLPDEAALLENAEVTTRGSYVALLACADVPAALNAFAQCFAGEPPADGSSETQSAQAELKTSEAPASSASSPQLAPEKSDTAPAEEAEPLSPETSQTAPEQPTPTPSSEPEASGESASTATPWSYDENRLLDAWAAGDWSSLAQEDQAILNVCQTVISDIVESNSSDYEKELAVHDWMLAWGSYDSNRLSQLPDFQENPNNDNPYGFLVDGLGICLGYTTTFQLFMDLLGITCITVEGTAYNYTTDHAWNQVYLDGEWYCVDVTWDDPTASGAVSEESAHLFFNITSDFMRNTNHQWDEQSVPEANGTAYAWQ